MEEFVMLILSFPGAVVRWSFFRILGEDKSLNEYLNDHYVLNGLVAILAILVVFILYLVVVA